MIVKLSPDIKRINDLALGFLIIFIPDLLFWDFDWMKLENKLMFSSIFFGIPLMNVVYLINNPRTIEINDTKVIYKGQFYTQTFERRITFLQKYSPFGDDSGKLYKLFDHKRKAYIRASQIKEEDFNKLKIVLEKREEILG